MRKIESKEDNFSNKLYLSVFVGVCKSKELLDEYLKQDLENPNVGLHSSHFGFDFNIKYYDDEYFVSFLDTQMSSDITEVFANAEIFDLNLLKQDYSNRLDKQYNTVIIIRRLKYEGRLQEIQNIKFGYFKFLGVYPEPLLDKINDDSEMDKYAINKLVDWGYSISVANENRSAFKDDSYFKNHFTWKAEKDEKIFSALDPLRLLGIVTIVREYGDTWDRIDVPNFFSVTFKNEK